MSLIRTYNPADGDVLDAPRWRSEIDALYALQQAVDGSRVVNNSIGRRKISDRYTLVPFYNEAVPKTPRVDPTLGAAHDSLDPATGYASATERTWECSNNGTEIEALNMPVITRVGSQAWLAAILFKAKELVTVSAGWPQVRIYRGTSTGRQLLGGGPQIIDTAERWYGLFGLDPVANPVIDVTTGQFIILTHESSVAAAAGARPRVRGLEVYGLLKVELSR